MSIKISKNKFGLFAQPVKQAALRNPSTDNSTLTKIDDFAETNHQRLLKEATDPIIRAKLLRSFHQVKPRTTKKYLQQFIRDFQHDDAFKKTVALYREKLAAYQNAKTMAAKNSLTASKQFTEAPKLTPQALDWQQLLETLKRCVNNRMTRDTLSWHPRHNENYYLAKLRIQWQRYEAHYDPIMLDNFSESLAHEIADGRRQTVVEKHLEAQQSLMRQKMEYSPIRLTRQQEKLEHEKQKDLEEINRLIPQFIEYTKKTITFAQQPANHAVQHVFSEAIIEIQRQERALAGNPALFKLTMGARHRNHALATLDKIDEAREMQTFREIFTEENATISTTLKS